MKKLTLVLSMMIALVGLNANAAIYIVGDGPFGGWNPAAGVEMTQNGDVYTYKATITGSVWFVFGDGQDSNWDTFNGQFRYGPTSGDETVEPNIEYTTQRGSNGAYKFTGSGEEYTFTFDETNLKFKVEGYVEPITVDTYTVAGSLVDLFGSTWSATDTNNDMTLVDGIYTWSKQRVELPAGAFEFKIVANHDWGTAYPSSNYSQPIEKHGYYNVTITFDADTKDVNCVAECVEEIIDEEDPIYTVTGSSAELFGDVWDAALLLEQNEMTKGNDGIYSWTKENVALTAGNIEFKVVLGHAWGVQYPAGDNYVANIEDNGNYNVEITFNPETGDITFAATPVVVTDDFYTVAGEPAEIFGEEWNPNYTANNMVKGEDGIYTWTKKDVEMAAEDVIEFKVVKNANWSTCYPDNNWHYECTADGIYDLTITFNPETSEVNFTATKHEEAPAVRGDVDGDSNVNIADVTALIDLLLSNGQAPASADCNMDGTVNIADVTTLIDYLLSGNWPVEEMVYTVVGNESVFGSNWDPADEANNMVEENGIYTWSKTGVTLYGNFEFKVVGNHDWSVYEWPIGMNNWVANVAEEGVYDILITFNPEADDADRISCTLTKTGDVAPVEHVYTVAGTENLFGSNWNPADEANDMVKGEDGIYTWTKNDVEFTDYATIEFKVVQDHAWTYAWPSSNWWAEIAEAGIYNFVITFDPNADDMSKISFTATKQQ